LGNERKNGLTPEDFNGNRRDLAGLVLKYFEEYWVLTWRGDNS
jgi:hypothetical protein